MFRMTLSSWPCSVRRAAVIRVSADLTLDHRPFRPDRDEVTAAIAEAIRDSAAPADQFLPQTSA
jgi:hypothetical protein